MGLIIKEVNNIIYIKDINRLCQLPYPGHKKGCPNYNKKESCPPNNQRFDEMYNVDKTIWMVALQFDLKAHMDKLRLVHPNWSDRQLRCVLYWQSKLRKMLRSEVNKFLEDKPDLSVDYSPERREINVCKMMEAYGIPLEWNGSKVWQVAFIGKLRKVNEPLQKSIFEF